MEICINGKPADITLENEKTVMDLLAGIQDWLNGSGLALSGLEIDGTSYGSRSLDSAFELPLEGLSLVNIKTSGWAELMMEALLDLQNDLIAFGTAGQDDRKAYVEQWDTYSPALFIKEHAADLYTAVRAVLEEQVPEQAAASLSAASSLVAERIRELENPGREIKALRPFAEEIAKRLEDLPLDMQTGKDGKASETITVFSALVEKIFRLIFLFRYFLADIDSIEVKSVNGPDSISLKDAIAEFSAALKEMIAAFENKDTVLVGDLAEYELAPRLRSIVEELCGMEEKST
jgi:hypothetical protein